MIFISRKSRLFYNGIPLIKYCKDNDINFATIKSSICKKRKDSKYSDYTEQEIVNMVINNYHKQIKYVYEGIPLRRYCKDNGINYDIIMHRILYLMKDYPELDNDELINIAMGKTFKNRRYKDKEYKGKKFKYFYKDIPLKEYCIQNNIDYDIVKHRLNYLQKNSPNLNDNDIEKIICETIEKIQIKNNIRCINEIFDFLRNEKVDNKQKLTDICNFLKIDYNYVVILKDMNLSYNQAINMIWYFFDNKSPSGYKQITQEKILEVYSLIDNIKNGKFDFSNIDLYDLISIYKSNLYDTRNEILLKLKGYILKTMKSLCTNYDIYIDQSNFEDFYSEIKLNILNAIEKSNLNIIGQRIKYIDLSVKGYFRLYLKKYKNQLNILSLNDIVFSKDKNNKNSKSRIDFIADKKNQYVELEEKTFSSNMLEILSDLPQEDMTFIILKFQENYTDTMLARYFKITIDEVKEREKKILFSLKDNVKDKIIIKK